MTQTKPESEMARLREINRQLVAACMRVYETAEPGKVAARGIDRIKNYRISPDTFRLVQAAIAKAVTAKAEGRE